MPNEIQTLCRSRNRTFAHLIFGEQVGRLLEEILPENVCTIAATTCRFKILGKNANGNEYGLGVRTFMQTYANAPTGIGGAGQPCIQYRGDWIELDSDDAADIVLDCYDLTIRDILDWKGWPENGKQYVVDLKEAVEALRPELLETDATTTAVA